MWTCESCGTAVRRYPERVADPAEHLGRVFFGLTSDALLCPRCREGVQTVGSAVYDVQQPPLCAGCRTRVERAWTAQSPARPGAAGVREGTFPRPAGPDELAVPSVSMQSS